MEPEARYGVEKPPLTGATQPDAEVEAPDGWEVCDDCDEEDSAAGAEARSLLREARVVSPFFSELWGAAFAAAFGAAFGAAALGEALLGAAAAVFFAPSVSFMPGRISEGFSPTTWRLSA